MGYDFGCCRLCPRDCGADRRTAGGEDRPVQGGSGRGNQPLKSRSGKEGQAVQSRSGSEKRCSSGFCGMPQEVRIARAALHKWEEPCISGYSDDPECRNEDCPGSGAVFFSGCTLRCVYCQNAPISAGRKGYPVSIQRLSEIFLELQEQGACNLNLVTPGHYAPQIIEALEISRESGFSLPVVWNSSGYESVETLKMLEGYVDIYLPDMKYKDSGLSAKYSGAPDYFEKAQAALSEMVRQQPAAVFEGNLMKRGVIVRHLLLPGCLMDSKRVVRYLYETYGDRIWLSLMSQYTPMPGVEKQYPELGRRVKKSSYEKLVQYAVGLGVTNAFVQEGGAAKESFIPDFDGTGVWRVEE